MSHNKADNGHGGNHAKKTPSKKQERRLQEVWATNLEDEIAKIRDQVEDYQHVGMDTLLPGIVARPTGPFGDYGDYNYQTLKSNVDLTRALQISFTICDAKGARPKGICTWRFNFAFDAGRDLLGQEHMAEGAGNALDLPRHAREGIDASTFGELLMSSGLVLNDEVKWVVFCGSIKFSDRAPEEKLPGRAGGEPASTTFCGLYNFAYLLQFLTSQPLPEEVSGFRESLDLFFPSRCDVAAHVHHLPPGPPLSSRDPADSLRRPLFCNGQHLLEAFFRLPDTVKATAFDPMEEPPPEAPTEKHRRRDDNGTKKSSRSAGGSRNSAPAAARNGVAN
jgi:hypothetical protein